MDIASFRLYNQHISDSKAKTLHDVVHRLGAVQGQDYAAAKWALALRVPGSTDKDVEKSIANKSIVRTWALRGTLHFVSAKDVRWMLSLLAQRIMNVQGTYYRKHNLDEATLNKSAQIMEHVLRDGTHATREELSLALEAKGISTKGIRITLILYYAALNRVLCYGVRRDKEFTYTLFETWVPESKALHREEALAKLALNYFTGHGPATVPDFAWWSGLSLTEAREGVELVKGKLIHETIDKHVYYMSPGIKVPSTTANNIYLLPGFDEYLLGYKDRSAITDDKTFKTVLTTGNGIFANMLIMNGRVEGIWKRTIKKDKIEVDIKPFGKLNKVQKQLIEDSVQRYGTYMGMPVVWL